jgi:hypothetical protein
MHQPTLALKPFMADARMIVLILAAWNFMYKTAN